MAKRFSTCRAQNWTNFVHFRFPGGGGGVLTDSDALSIVRFNVYAFFLRRGETRFASFGKPMKLLCFETYLKRYYIFIIDYRPTFLILLSSIQFSSVDLQ